MKLDQVEYSAPSTKLGVVVTEKHDGENKPEITFEDFFYEFKEYIEVNLTDQVLHDEWYSLYAKEPDRFFKDVAALKAMEVNKRILFLIKQSALLCTSTKDVEDYFTEFPDDAKKIKSCLEEDNYKPKKSYQFDLLGLCSEYLERNFHVEKDPTGRGSGIPNQYFEICERKKHAKELLMSNTSFIASNEKYEPFGDAGKEFGKQYSLACTLSMSGDEAIGTSFMDGANFESLDNDKKCELLLIYLSSLHEALLFDEVHNSQFTKEYVERANKFQSRQGYNTGHSMIYKTYQSRHAYKMHQDFFLRNMNNSRAIGGGVEEYPFHRLLLKTLEKLVTVEPSKEVSNLVTEFWNKNRNPIFSEAVSKVLSIHFPENAAVEMMKVIKKEPDNNALTSTLYRLELSKVGVGPKGLEYLGRLYDLAEYNNPSFFAQRLSVNGELGIFKESGEMIGMTTMADPSDVSEKEHEIVRATVNAITVELLFASKEGDEEEQKLKNEILEEFTIKYDSFHGKELLKNAGVQLNNLTLTEQGWYMFFARTTKNKEVLVRFLTKYKELGVKVMQSMESGFDIESLILFVNDADEGQCKSVFAVYSEIINFASDIDRFMGVSMSSEEKQYFSEKILSAGKSILVKILDGGKKGSLGTTLNELSNLESETVVFVNCFRELRSTGKEFSIEDIRGSFLKTLQGGSISAVDTKAMRDIYESNDDNNETNQKLLLKDFDQKTTDSQARFHIFKWNDQLQAYVVFQDTEDGYTKGSALNVRKDIQGYKIGEAILTQIINEEAKRRPLLADVLVANSIVPKYLDTGWVATKYFIDNGDPVLDIVQDLEANKVYWGKSATPEAIMSLTAAQKVGRQDVIIEIAHTQKDLIEKYKDSFKKGLCLTRIIRNSSEDMYYGVFEPFLKPEPRIKKVYEDISEVDSTEKLLTE